MQQQNFGGSHVYFDLPGLGGNGMENNPNLESRLMSALYSSGTTHDGVVGGTDGQTDTPITYFDTLDSFDIDSAGLIIENLDGPFAAQQPRTDSRARLPRSVGQDQQNERREEQTRGRPRVGSKRLNAIKDENAADQRPTKRRNSSISYDEFVDLINEDKIHPGSPLSPSVICGTQNLRLKPLETWAPSPLPVTQMSLTEPDALCRRPRKTRGRKMTPTPRKVRTTNNKPDVKFDDLSEEEKMSRLKTRVVLARARTELKPKKKRKSHKRSAYLCKLCGQPKRNHKCPYEEDKKKGPKRKKSSRFITIGIQCEMDANMTILAAARKASSPCE